eukprot:gene153-4399_t
MSKQKFWSDTPFTLGHRGMGKDPVEYPENTLVSFQQAFDIGLTFIECDVRKSKDGELFVIHDEDLDRTTNVNGKILNFTSEELKNIETKEKKEKIPTMKELLELIKKNENCRLFIELKENDCHKELINLIQLFEVETQINIISFHFDYLKEIRNLNSTIEIGLLLKNLPDNIHKLTEELEIQKITNLGIGWWILNSEIVEKLNSKFKVWCWNPPTSKDILKMLELKVIGLGSNDPKMTKEIIEGTTLKQ